MPQVDFYVTDAAGEDTRLRLACRVTEKAYLAGHRVLVWCRATDELARFDELLWTFADGSFVPHEPLAGAGPEAQSPVALSSGVEPAAAPEVLVNLDAEIPPLALQAQRVAEFIDGHPTRRSEGRARFRQYREQGITPITHQLGSGSL